MKTTSPNLLNPTLHLAGGAVVALAIGGFYVLAYRPLVAQGAEYESRIAQLRMLQDQAGPVHREHRLLRARLADMRRAVASVRDRSAAEPVVVEFVSDLRDAANRLGLEVTDHHTAPARTLATHSEAELDVRCVGDYATICRFLHEAESLARLVKITNLTIRPPASDGRQPVEITFVLYYGLASNDTDEKR